MRKENFYFTSADNITKIRGVKYLPDDNKVHAIFQIIHGMCEFIDRYDDFANYLCSKGYLVVGIDLLGHGESVTSKDNWGYFADDLENGYKIVDEDCYNLTKMIKKEYPNLPLFLLGHSMGAYFGQYYMFKHGEELTGCIIMGTGKKDYISLSLVKNICRVIAKFKTWRYRSNFINSLALGSYNKHFEPSDNHVDWLTKDVNICNAYAKEPKCQFIFTLNAYYNLFSIIEECNKTHNLKMIPEKLPILFTAGQDDPVGDFGKAPIRVCNFYRNMGLKNTKYKIYEDDRHEILNELDKNDVYNNLYNWMESNLTRL